MNHLRDATVVASDLSCRPMAVSKPIVQVLHYDCTPGKSSPESTNKTMDASSCTSWSELSRSSNNSRGGATFGASKLGNNPTSVSRSLPELESVNEDGAGEEIDQYEQDEVSVITD